MYQESKCQNIGASRSIQVKSGHIQLIALGRNDGTGHCLQLNAHLHGLDLSVGYAGRKFRARVP